MNRVYGLVRVARCWNVSGNRVSPPAVAGRPETPPGPVGPGDDATLLQHIRQAIAESRFTGEGYRKIWARLRFADWCNSHWLVARHRHRTPAHVGADQQLVQGLGRMSIQPCLITVV